MRAFIILFACLLTITSITVQAQFKQLAEGPEFEEPADGYAKIIQLKNGSVFYLHVTMKNGVNVRIYDAAHIEKKATSFQPLYGELSEKMRDKVMAVFEINNDVVFFVYHTNEGMPTLYRLIVDGATGKLKQQKAISVIEKEWKISTFVTVYFDDFFVVKKDPVSDCYAVTTHDFREKDPSRSRQIVHYNGNHSEISRLWFPAKTDEVLETKLIDFVVMGEEKVLGLASCGKWEDKKYALVDIKKGSVIFNKIDVPEDRKYNVFSLFKFNPVTKKLIFFNSGSTNPKKNEEYATNAYLIDPADKTVQPLHEIGLSEKSQDYYKNQFNEKKGFRGMLQDVVIDPDGGFTILYEDMIIVPNSSMGVKTSLEAMAAVLFNKEGNRIGDYVIPKSHWISHKSFQPLYKYREEFGAVELFESNQYKSFAYLGAGSQKYILFNDSEKNNNIDRFKLGGQGRGVGMKGVTELISLNSDTDAFMYLLDGADAIPERLYVFEEKDKIHSMALMNAAAYNSENNIYITLRFDKKTGKGIMARMVWMQVK